MSTSPLSVFKKSLLAAAIVTATGCASTGPDHSGGGFGDTLKRTGAATADATSRAWHRTTYLLGFHDNGGPVSSGDDRFATQNDQLATQSTRVTAQLDEVDLALMEDDAVMPGYTGTESASTIERVSARIDRAIIQPNLPAGTPRDDVLRSDALESVQVGEVMPSGAGDFPLDSIEENRSVEMVVLDDYTHTVDKSETLWDIAKATTGDATNWHVIADVNNLAPNAAVFPGQSLVIPADMLRPELAVTPDAPEQTIIAEASERLTIPEAAPDTLATADPVSTQPGLAADAIAAAPANSLAAASGAAEPVRIVTASASPVANPITGPAYDAMAFAIEAGETLWDFAKRTTGDATYWQAIAAHNEFTESQAVAVRQGQEIFVPEVLVRPELSTTTLTTAAPGVIEAAASTTLASAEDIESLDAGAAVLAGTNGLQSTAIDPITGRATIDEAAADLGVADQPIADNAITGTLDERDITIVEAAFRSDAEVDLGSDATAIPSTSEIMISGTYYPKAVYGDADFSSGLLMRVSPGTTLKVSAVDGAWYEVETEQGPGFVHQRDVK